MEVRVSLRTLRLYVLRYSGSNEEPTSCILQHKYGQPNANAHARYTAQSSSQMLCNLVELPRRRQPSDGIQLPRTSPSPRIQEQTTIICSTHPHFPRLDRVYCHGSKSARLLHTLLSPSTIFRGRIVRVTHELCEGRYEIGYVGLSAM